jgi:hypothetical protein
VLARVHSGVPTKSKENPMRQKLTCLAIFSAVLVVTALYHSKNVQATAASGFKATTLATGTFNDIEVFNQATRDSLPAGFPGEVWISLQKTHGPSDLYVQSNAWPAVNLATGAVASTGWHTHPGHSLIIVTSGSITEYEDDCTPHVYTFVAGQPAPTLVDPGHGHVHIIRNEGTVPAASIAVQLVPFDPAKANRRIDAPAPANCTNIQ